MNPSSAKIISSLLVPIMSFLGWSTSDYAKFLPEEIRSQIIIEISPIEIIATSTKPIAPIKAKPSAAIPALPKAKSPIIPQSPKPKISAPAKMPEPIIVKPLPSPVIPPPVATAQIPTQAPIENLSNEEKIKRSTVNILCSMQRGNLIQKYTGSGVMIAPSGVIITNAHVAEHVMLAQAGFETCQIRTGSPARNSYKAKVIYLPDAWINANKNNLQMQTLTGTGENDYALLLITERTAANAPNVPLPYLAPSEKSFSSGDAITLAGYPAGFGNASLLESSLYLLEKPSLISALFGFTGSGNDVINTPSTPLAEHGSSGGAIVASDGNLIGIINSTIIDNQSGQKAIQGISINYIKNSIQNNLGKSLQSLIENAQAEANNFAVNKVQSLSTILMQ